MKRNLIISVALAGAFFVLSGTASGHHGTPLYYGKTTITLQGAITEFAFVNPHVQIYFDVKDEKGNVQHWAAECASPGLLRKTGFTRDSLKPGDQVTITVHPGKSGDTIGNFVKIVLPDGKELPIRTGGE